MKGGLKMTLVLVGIGGMAGSLARFQIGKIIAQKSKTVFPLGTFIINLSGAVLLGIVTGLKIPHSMYLLMADGFLGAFTTFSTFMYEGFNLFHDNEKKNAFVYIFLTLVLGVVGYITGFTTSGLLI